MVEFIVQLFQRSREPLASGQGRSSVTATTGKGLVGLLLVLLVAWTPEVHATDYAVELEATTKGAKTIEGNLLHAAAMMSPKPFIQSLLNSSDKDYVNGKDKFGYTPIHWAAAFRSREVVGMFLAAGAEVMAKGEMGLTPLHLAARYGNTKVFEVLLAAGAKVNARNKDHMTPLHWAAIEGKPDAVKALLEAGANPFITMGSSRITPLLAARIELEKNEGSATPYFQVIALLKQAQLAIEKGLRGNIPRAPRRAPPRTRVQPL